jgi:hypothetical protein
MRAAPVAGVVLLTAACAAAASETPLGQSGLTTSCSWSSPQATSFDLSALKTTSGYTVTDVRDATTQYWFNVCGDIAAPNVAQCGTNGRPTSPATAWQMQNSFTPPTCYRLGNSSSAGWTFSLIGACPHAFDETTASTTPHTHTTHTHTHTHTTATLQTRTTPTRASTFCTVEETRHGALSGDSARAARLQYSSSATLPPPRRRPRPSPRASS